MPTTNIPDQDDLLRHVKAKLVVRDPDTHEPIGFTPQAFELRPSEDCLSASWVQYFPGTRGVAVGKALTEFAGSGVLEIRKNDLFALGVVREIKAACAGQGVKVRIVHDGEDYPSHAAVRQFQGATLELLGLLASQAWAGIVAPTPAVIKASKRTR